MASSSSRSTVQKAYIAYYGRPADPGGLTYWANRLEEEGSLSAIIESFGNSEEFISRFGGLSNTQLIQQVYTQLFGRDPDPEGLIFYAEKLDGGVINLQTFTLDVLNGASGADVKVIESKLLVANYFTDHVSESAFTYSGSVAIQQASDLISGIAGSETDLELVARVVNFFESIEEPTTPYAPGNIPLGQTKTGEIEVVSDEDWFAISLEANTTYLFTMSSTELETAYLKLRDNRGYSIESDTQSFDENRAEIGYTPDQSGTYYLSASDLFDGSTGEYQIGFALSGTTDDYTDDTSTSGSIALGQSKTGEIEVVSDEDWFAISLEANTTYLFTMSSTELETAYLKLRDNRGYSIESDTQSFDENRAEIGYTPDQSGTYYLSASDLFDGSTGEYQIGFALSGTTDDYTDDTSTSGSIALGQSKTGEIEVVSDEDWFAISLEANTTYLFTMSSTELETAYLKLRDNRGYSIESDTQSFDENRAEIGYTPDQSGTYYLSASDLFDGSTGEYQIGFALSGTTDDYTDDYTDDTSTSGSIALGQSKTGEIEVVSDEDWFAISLEANTTYLFGMSSTELETAYLKLRDNRGYSIESDSQSFDENRAEIGYTPDQSGTYYLSASDLFDGSTGEYQIGFALSGTTDDYTDDTSTSGSIALGQSKTGEIEVVSDEDWFAISLEANTTYLFGMSSTELETAYLKLRDNRGYSIESDSQSFDENRAEIGYTPDQSGTYYLSASDLFDGSTGEYQIGFALSGTTDDYWPG